MTNPFGMTSTRCSLPPDPSRARALSSGAMAFFAKPVDTEVLLRAVASVVAGAEVPLS